MSVSFDSWISPYDVDVGDLRLVVSIRLLGVSCVVLHVI